MNKKGMSMVLVGAILAIVMIILGVAYYETAYAGVEKSTDKVMDQQGDFDNDGIINAFDRCCPTACEVLSGYRDTVDTDPSSRRYGCAEYQEPTSCTAEQCNIKPEFIGEKPNS